MTHWVVSRTVVKSTTSSPQTRDGEQRSEPLSRLIDWLVTAVLVLGGLLAAAAGGTIYSLTDRELISDLVADGTVTSDDLTDAELVEVSLAALTWGSIGLVVTGLLVAIAGAAFLRYRRQPSTGGQPDTLSLAVVGAAVTFVTAFLPVSPLIGGLAAGYLRGGSGGDGAKVGAFAGVAAAIPYAVFGLFVMGGLLTAVMELGVGGLAPVIGFATLLAALVSVVTIVALSAVGGYIGVVVTES